MGTLQEQMMALLVCDRCGSPVEFDKADKVYRHREPQPPHCPKRGYPVTTAVKAK